MPDQLFFSCLVLILIKTLQEVCQFVQVKLCHPCIMKGSMQEVHYGHAQKSGLTSYLS